MLAHDLKQSIVTKGSTFENPRANGRKSFEIAGTKILKLFSSVIERNMNRTKFIENFNQKSVLMLRRYPFQILSAVSLTLILFAIFSTAFFLPFKTKGQSLFSTTTPVEQSNTQPNLDANNGSGLTMRASYADVVEKTAPAVVTVRSERKVAAQQQNLPFNDPMFRQFFGDKIPQMKQPQPQIERGLGSGVIVSADGTILTNNHVVAGASEVKVDLPDKQTYTAKVVGTDEPSDLAVLKIEAENLPTLSIGNSDAVRVGDVVLAIGNPLGLRQTVTSGIISAKGRQTGLSDGSFEDFLQTDAAINQGNSGGALINTNGELIGINSQILSPSGGNIGIGFAIPANMAKSVMQQLMSGGKVRRGQLGVGIQDVTSALAENFGLKEIRGVIVNSVSQGSPADKAGLKRGDVITNFNGANISDGNDLRNKVAQTAPGTEVSIGFLRDNKEQTATVTLGEFQPQKNVEETESPNGEPSQGKLGLSLQQLTPQIAQQLGLKNVSEGLVVMEVQPGSAADEAGIGQGDVITEINRSAVNSIDDVKQAIAKAETKPLLLLVIRQGQTRFVSVKP